MARHEITVVVIQHDANKKISVSTTTTRILHLTTDEDELKKQEAYVNHINFMHVDIQSCFYCNFERNCIARWKFVFFC